MSRRFTPLLLSFFSFILVAALLGLLPFGPVSTSNLAVALALATVSFVAQQAAGIRKHGVVGHFRQLMPPGLPLWLLPIMVPVEILGAPIKEVGDAAASRRTLEELITKYPQSESASKAKQRLGMR